MSVIEVLSKEEDVWDDQSSDFSICITHESTVINVSSYPDNNHS